MNRFPESYQLRRPWYGTLAPDASSVGVQLKNNFVTTLAGIVGDLRFLWMPKSDQTTSSTELSRYAAVVTYNATFAGQYEVLGSGLYATFDGTADEGDTPDPTDNHFTFGDGATDQPFSVFALCSVTADAAADAILTKWVETTGSEAREWNFYIDASEKFTIQLFDESANTYIGGQFDTALTSATWTIIGATYDGSASNLGCALYKDGTEVALTTLSSGTYVAMEDLTSVVKLAHVTAAGGGVGRPFKGNIAFAMLCAKALSPEEVWEMKVAVNSFYDLGL